MVTFDGLRHSCQAQGDFVLLRDASGLQVQAQFKKKSELVSLVTGIAVRSGATAPTLEVVVANGEQVASGSPVELLMNGASLNAAERYEDEFYRVVPSGQAYLLIMKATNVTIRAKFLNPGFPHFDARVALPQAYIDASSSACGLLGTPDNRPANDWVTADCTPIADMPTSYDALFFREAYEYCTSNWCIREASSSLFSYTDVTFDAFSGCDDPYPGPVDIFQISPELEALCGVDIPCRIDGIEIGIAAAQSLLESESVLGRASFLQAKPALIQVGSPFNVEFTVDLRTLGTLPVDLESFQLYRVNSEARYVGFDSVVTLLDVGSGIGRDLVANDGIFSNVLAMRSDYPGEWFGFRAVPVLGGVEDPASLLAFESLNLVRSYSVESGIGENATSGGSFTAGSLTAPNASELVVFIEYTWPLDQSDLDTGTEFLGKTVGFACDARNGTQYLNWIGDDAGFGIRELVTADLGRALVAGEWTGSTTIELNSAWFPGSSGPATVSVYVQVGTVVSFAFDPGQRNFGDRSCTLKVGQVDVVVTEAGGAIIDVTRTVKGTSEPTQEPTISMSPAPTTPYPTPEPTTPYPTPEPTTPVPTPEPTISPAPTPTQ